MSADHKQKPLEWMYGGSSSSVNREDFLTGKRIDKNYEKVHSDFQDEPSQLDRVIRNKTISGSGKDAPSTSKTSALLELETVRKEDPLVAIKVREEQMRREIFENPVKMKRLQKIVLKSMEKKMKKIMKKKRHRRSSNDSRSPDEESDTDDDQSRRRKRSRSRERSAQRRRSRDSKNSERKRHSRDRETTSRGSHRKRTDSRSSRKATPPRRRDDSASSAGSVDSETGERRKRIGYGLIHFKGRKESTERKPPQRSPRSRSPPPKLSTKSTQPPVKQKSVWKPLSEEEMERKRKEMMDNAKWRDEQRKRNLKRYAKEEEDQTKSDTKQKGEAVEFIRKLVATSTDTSTVEGRVKSKVQRLQRSEASMHTNFARK